jgi:hypothetical protein
MSLSVNPPFTVFLHATYVHESIERAGRVEKRGIGAAVGWWYVPAVGLSKGDL